MLLGHAIEDGVKPSEKFIRKCQKNIGDAVLIRLADTDNLPVAMTIAVTALLES